MARYQILPACVMTVSAFINLTFKFPTLKVSNNSHSCLYQKYDNPFTNNSDEAQEDTNLDMLYEDFKTYAVSWSGQVGITILLTLH